MARRIFEVALLLVGLATLAVVMIGVPLEWF
jgi:hypothetical protein